jgi:hypothetical protein
MGDKKGGIVYLFLSFFLSLYYDLQKAYLFAHSQNENRYLKPW